MDFCTQINSLLIQRNFKDLGDKFYLPNSSPRPSRSSPPPNSFGKGSSLPAPLESLAKKFWEAGRLVRSGGGDGDASLMGVAAFQPVLNLCREFFK